MKTLAAIIFGYADAALQVMTRAFIFLRPVAVSADRTNRLAARMTFGDVEARARPRCHAVLIVVVEDETVVSAIAKRCVLRFVCVASCRCNLAPGWHPLAKARANQK